MSTPDDVKAQQQLERAQQRLERAARRLARSQRYAGDRGPGYTPRLLGSTPWTAHDERDFWLDREIEMLQRALADQGEMGRADLARAVGAKYWGPGRFGQALRAAAARGAIGRTGFRRYGPPGGGPPRDAGATPGAEPPRG
jgi:hypothetical protein